MGSPCRGAPRQGLMAPPASEFPDLTVQYLPEKFVKTEAGDGA